MPSVPVWFLTAVIEVGLLYMATLSMLLWLVWRRQRCLTLKVGELQRTLVAPSMVAAMPAEWPAETGEEGLDVAFLTEPSPVTAESLHAASGADACAAEPVAEMGLGEPEPELLATTETGEMLDEEPSVEVTAAVAPTVTLTQEMLDSLFAAAAADETEEVAEMQEQQAAEIQRSVIALLSESADMEQQVGKLQDKGQVLREAIAALQANVALPLEEQQDLPVPEKIMQEMEQGLMVLQQGCKRMQHELQVHCQSLGLASPEAATASGVSGEQGEAGDRPSAAVLQEEVVNLKSVLEQRAAEFQHVQEEYKTLLEEYQRIFER